MAKRRGFETAEEHDKHIIYNWNKVVGKRDVTWILGDITMEKIGPYPLLDKLNGIKKVILGNHDEPQHVPELLKYVNNVCAVQYKTFKGQNIIFSHIPIHPKELEYRFNINIHGHTHSNFISLQNEELEYYRDARYINVCAEVIDYQPKLLEELLNDEWIKLNARAYCTAATG
jgi:calcineurin-like phosphoesterase family protein